MHFHKLSARLIALLDYDPASCDPIEFSFNGISLSSLESSPDVLHLPRDDDEARDKERIAMAVCDTTPMTLDRWDKLDQSSRGPWLERTIAILARNQTVTQQEPIALLDSDWEDYTYDGGLLTTTTVCELFGVTSSDLSKSDSAKKHRRPNPDGRTGGDFVYRYKDVCEIANRKDKNKERRNTPRN